MIIETFLNDDGTLEHVQDLRFRPDFDPALARLRTCHGVSGPLAVNHDTSVVMLERTYCKHSGDHSDVLHRRALLDTARPAVGNVLPLLRQQAAR
jgi:hypothetical protein